MKHKFRFDEKTKRWRDTTGKFSRLEKMPVVEGAKGISKKITKEEALKAFKNT